MGHLYHGYVSHNQRVSPITEILSVCRFDLHARCLDPLIGVLLSFLMARCPNGQSPKAHSFGQLKPSFSQVFLLRPCYTPSFLGLELQKPPIFFGKNRKSIAEDMVDNGLALLSKHPMTPVGELPVTGAQHAPAAQHATGQQLVAWVKIDHQDWSVKDIERPL